MKPLREVSAKEPLSGQKQFQKLLRFALFAFLAVLVSPFRYFSVRQLLYIDASWLYLMSLAAVQGRKPGIDLFWTTGPIAYLFHPLDVAPAGAMWLPAQAFIATVLLYLVGLLVFRSGTSVPRLTAFSLCVAAASPWFHFNGLGVENLLLLAVLVLIAFLLLSKPFRWWLFAALLGLIPLIFLMKGTGAVMALGALAGFLVALAVRDRRRALVSTLLSVLVLPLLAVFGYWLSTGSADVSKYVRGMVEISANYSVAMSLPGSIDEELGAGIALILVALIFLIAARRRDPVALLALPLAVPLLVSLKHGFVRQGDLRQDYHVVNFFGFVLVVLGIYLLFIGRDHPSLAPWWVAVLFTICTISPAFRMGGKELILEASGWANLERFDAVMRHASEGFGNTSFRTEVPLKSSLTPEAALMNLDQVRALGGRRLTVISPNLIWPPLAQVSLDRVNLVPLPVVQGYQACTPFLDQKNADWLANSAPENLLLEWKDIDGRHPLGNPATLLSMLRWYGTELEGPSSLLLERRSSPRSLRLTSVELHSQAVRDQLVVPEGSALLFMRVIFSLTGRGRVTKFFYRIPEVDMNVANSEGREYIYRIVPELMSSPILISVLPNSLDEAARVFGDEAQPVPRIKRVFFSGPGLDYYHDTASIELLRADQSSDGG